MSAQQAIVRTFKIAGFKAEVSVPRVATGRVSSAVIEWTPRVPHFASDFTAAQRLEYRLKLIAAIAEIRQ